MKKEQLKEGDLLFTVGDSEMGQAITTATGDYSHVAIYLEGSIYHATVDQGVSKQDLTSFLEENKIVDVFCYPKIKLKQVFEKVHALLGNPYNISFYPDGTGFYCSQLIAHLLPIFAEIPMQFGDGHQEVTDFWQEYYEQLGLAVPTGRPGTNPSLLAQSPQLCYRGRLK
ncbi:YiiX/YebB-like N1pC/P60 family cysteine hydrolase [Streptococcus tangpeifui]|uniref:YiiX/YebB-like N1pC/P60 family cysteine hydrolase n=1 Tax=Streptococcus tangpeifui TaxID=2709400 RepID=UPI0013ED4327|nr:YiiX/YebB-like N1pC/P60 family cysteine hydrolase [Streptococcus sp. ZJ373]